VISAAAVKAIARKQSVDPMVVDLDHALGVVLWALSEVPSDETQWVFKGGTCLRKAYYRDYRFSEDLDFTIVGRLRLDDVRDRIDAIARPAREAGIYVLVEDARVKTSNDDYGHGSIEVRLPYRGALGRRGTPPSIQFHLSADEKVALQASRRSLIHPYDDASEIACTVMCYAPEEMLAEKLRAAGGQRRYAISRDIYDIAQLISRGVDVDVALEILPEKAALKGVDLSVAADKFRKRREEYRADWDRALVYLVDDAGGFESAFVMTEDLLGRSA